jgi:hypothetical protein
VLLGGKETSTDETGKGMENWYIGSKAAVTVPGGRKISRIQGEVQVTQAKLDGVDGQGGAV